jgi:hypothetical protein
VKIKYEKPIIDCAHLIDLPSTRAVFNDKVKENAVTNPKACIRILSVFYPKNGLINLL